MSPMVFRMFISCLVVRVFVYLRCVLVFFAVCVCVLVCLFSFLCVYVWVFMLCVCLGRSLSLSYAFVHVGLSTFLSVSEYLCGVFLFVLFCFLSIPYDLIIYLSVCVCL